MAETTVHHRVLSRLWRSIARLAPIVAIVLMTSAVVVGQNVYYQAYDRGLKAYKDNNLPLARQYFERALQLDGRQARSKNLGGTFFGAYLPDYYLGLISVREGKFDEAIAHFDKVRALISPKDEEYPTLSAQRTVAEEAVKAATLARANIPAPGTSSPRASDNPPVIVPAPTTDPARSVPSAPVVTRDTPVVSRVEDPVPAPPPATAPAEPVPSAPKPSTSTATDVSGLSAEVARSLDRGEFDRAWDGIRRLSALPGGAASAQGLTGRARTLIAASGENLLKANDPAAAGRLSDLLTRIAPTSVEARNLRRLVDERLKDARLERDTLKLLLLGDYRRVIELTAQSVDVGPASPRVLFFAACGQAALSLTSSPDARAALITDARRLFGRASGTGASFAREEQYISPEILDVLKGR